VLTIPSPCPLWNPVVTHLHGNWHLTGVVQIEQQEPVSEPDCTPALSLVTLPKGRRAVDR
jgi:hypothetical protein